MNPRVLIVGGGLSGLATAFRLRSQGLDITILDQKKSFHSRDPAESLFLSGSEASLHTDNSIHGSNALPIVIHGHHHATLDLLKELGTDSHFTSHNAVNLEFLTSAQNLIGFKPIASPCPLHVLLGLLFFRGMPIQDRWALIKTLEQLWEGDLELPPDLDSQHAHTWLSTFGQSEQACRYIWQPLCQFFLGTSSSQCSAQSFQKTLARHFLSSRRNTRTFISPLDESTLLLKPLYDKLCAYRDIRFRTDCRAIHFQYDSKGITAVKLGDGTTLSADFYVSALPRKTLISCLHERLLSKFSYFSNLLQLSEVPAVIVNLEIPYTTASPRLLLSSNTFQWMALWPHIRPSTGLSLISGVASDNLELFEQSDQELLSELASTCSFLPPSEKKINASHFGRVLRSRHAFLSCTPNISSFRPIQKSPLPNLFVAGPWTDTDLPPSRDSSIVSGNLCAQAVVNSVN